jgi:choline transport protein
MDAKSKEMQDHYTVDGIEDGGHISGVGSADKGFTKRDQRDMQRLGKRQELMRNFRPLSALSFTVLLQATWEFMLMWVSLSR